jgi:hypothetical protein
MCTIKQFLSQRHKAKRYQALDRSLGLPIGRFVKFPDMQPPSSR